MSLVDNYTLFLSVLNDEGERLPDLPEVIVSLNGMLAQIDTIGSSQGGFKRVEQYAGGNKHIEHGVFMFAANYGHITQVGDAIGKIAWPDPEGVMLVWMGQHEKAFQAFSLDQLEEYVEKESP